MFGVLAWLGRAITGFAGFTVANTLGQVAAHQSAEAVARLLRIGVALGIIVVLFNAITPSYCSSLYTCWDNQKNQLGSIATNIAYFVPVDLLLCLCDLYVFMLMILFSVSAVRRVYDFGK